MLQAFFVLVSFFLVALGQGAWLPQAGLVASIGGYALFWKAMLSLSSRWRRFFLAASWFAAVHAVQLSWMSSIHYMGFLFLGVYAFLLVGLAVQFGLFSCMLDMRSKKPYRQAAAAAGVFVILEWMRLYFLTGFTWNPAGMALACGRYSIQFASLFGIYGLSFWVILTNLAGLLFFLRPSKLRIGVWALLACIPHGFGFLQQTLIEQHGYPTRSVAIALVDTALKVEQKTKDPLCPERFIPAIEQWSRLWQFLDSGPRVDLVALPEAAFPYGLEAPWCPLSVFEARWKHNFGSSSAAFHPPLRAPFAFPDQRPQGETWLVTNAFMAATLSNYLQADLIVGLNHCARGTNAAFLFRPGMSVVEEYDKRVLVPAGEYIPLQSVAWIAKFLDQEFGISEPCQAGKEAKVFASHLPVGIAICSEEGYSELLRGVRNLGAQMLVSVSNDVWFPDSKLAEQHFEHARVRAAENGVFLFRSTNMGITGVIDCFGHPIESRGVSGQMGAVYLSVPVFSYATLYSFWGDFAILVLSGCFICLGLRKKLPLNGYLR